MFVDPIGKLLGLRQKAHPWHGIDLGDNVPDKIIAFIEMLPTDTVKYELDKKSGYLVIDRPQKYSSILPTMYGFIPQTYCGKRVGQICADAVNRPDIAGDGDPLDICVLTEKNISTNQILVRCIPIGGFRMIDRNKADDKIVAVLENDAVYGKITDINQLPIDVVQRLKHYFLTYKDMPDDVNQKTEITHIYDAQEAKKIILASIEDYKDYLNETLFNK